MNRTIMCIDLKSFFASCECVDKKLDPYKFPLVVANPIQGNGAITLAVTPYLKEQGVKSRSRLYEIPPYIKYTIATPRMGLYKMYSQKVVDVYLEFVSIDDLYAYSIDECFLDLTNYLNFYKLSDVEIGKLILKTIFKRTGLTASCGIGPNPFLAKVAMDTQAKNNNDSISKWTYNNYKTELYKVSPLRKIWGIGPKLEKKLMGLGIFTIEEFVNCDKEFLNKRLGVVAGEIHSYLNGFDNRTIKSMKEETKDKSYSLSQTFYKDYSYDNTKIIINELSDLLSCKLRNNKKETSTITLKVSYSKDIGGFFNKSISLPKPTNSYNTIRDVTFLIFEQYYEELPIRKVEIHLSRITDKLGTQLDLFESKEKIIDNNNINNTIDSIKNKYGNNIINRASSLLDDSNIIKYNEKHSEKKLEPKIKF